MPAVPRLLPLLSEPKATTGGAFCADPYAEAVSVGAAEHGFTCTESMLIVSPLEIQELLWVHDRVHVQNPYKNASLNPYIIESKGWLPKKRVFKLFSQDFLIFSGPRDGF